MSMKVRDFRPVVAVMSVVEVAAVSATDVSVQVLFAGVTVVGDEELPVGTKQAGPLAGHPEVPGAAVKPGNTG